MVYCIDNLKKFNTKLKNMEIIKILRTK